MPPCTTAAAIPRWLQELSRSLVARCPQSRLLSRRCACRQLPGGFVVNNNVQVHGAVLAHGSLWMMWRARTPADVTPESLAYLRAVKPVPDLLIFGSGAAPDMPPRETLRLLRELHIGFEALRTVRSRLSTSPGRLPRAPLLCVVSS